MGSVQELLRSTVEDLHRLSTFSELGNQLEYETLLKQTITHIIKLVDWDDTAYQKLNITINPHLDGINSLDILYYVKRGESPTKSSIPSKEILTYFQQYQYSKHKYHDTILNQLSKLLQETHTNASKSVLQSFATFITFLINFHKDCETQIIKFLTKCFTYDLKFQTKIRHDLNTNLHQQDTLKIVEILDKLMGSEIHQDNNVEISHNTSGLPLVFRSSHEGFTSLYNILLEIACIKHVRIEDANKFAEMFLYMFKSHFQISSLEIDTFAYKEKKFDSIYELLLSILPDYFSDINAKVINDWSIFPEMKRENEIITSQGGIGIVPSLNLIADDVLVETNLHNTKRDRSQLLNHFRRIIPLLNEFNLQFDIDFVSILYHYLTLLYESLPTSGVIADFNYVDQLITLLNIIIDFENGKDETQSTNFKTTVYRLHDLHKYLSKSSVASIPSTTLLMRISVIEYYKNIQIEKILLNNWNSRTDIINQLIEISDQWSFNNQNRYLRVFLKLWYTRKCQLQDLHKEAIRYDTIMISDKHFNHIINAYKHHKHLMNNADIRFTKSYFTIWSDKSINSEGLVVRAINLRSINLLKSGFSKWKRAYQFQTSLKSLAIKKRSQWESHQNFNILQVVFVQWYTRMTNSISNGNGNGNGNVEIDSNKLKTLTQLERKYLLKKQFNKWMTMYCLMVAKNSVKVKNDKLLLEYMFRKRWLTKAAQESMARKNRHEKDQIMKQQLFIIWKDLTLRRSQAEALFRKNKLNHIFTLWKLNTIAQGNNSHILQQFVVKQSFKSWKLKYKLAQVTSQSCKRLEEIQFVKWHNHLADIIELTTYAEDLEVINLKKRYAQVWLNRYNSTVEVSAKADQWLKQRIFNRWKSRYIHYKDMDKSINNNFNFNFNTNDLLVKSVLRLWKRRFEYSFEQNSAHIIDNFQTEYRDKNIKARAFSIWKSSYDDVQLRQKSIEARERDYFNHYKQNNLPGYFDKWRRLGIRYEDLYEQGISFEETVLKKKSMVIWYGQYINKGIYLNEIAEEFLDDNSFRQVQDILSNWAMRVMKVRRNEQSCDLFIKRWDSSRAKLIFELWKWKTQTKDSSFDDSEISNSSPLASRSSRISSDKNISYLFTPLKKQVPSRIPYSTPGMGINRTSPSRLLETTQRLRNEKMDEIRKHFRGIKSSSTPKKEVIGANVFNEVSITYPRLEPLTSSSILPPKAPIFEAQTGNSDSRITFDKRSIETAKKFRRITPIKFPTNDEVDIDTETEPETEREEPATEFLGFSPVSQVFQT
ncbi:Sfi1 spindle body protein-domain-containing protein [Scheffersomyces amazonensis]|uniref:Sfi1 spindle body protein-domain-containing protein n=1 Tax=Scheffersomyces amazonensis TaxID=1078765 RepID=UPI00315D62AE